jgi:type III secretion protein D
VLLMWWTVGTPNDAASRQNGGDLSALRRELASYPEVELVAAAGDQMQLNGFVESQLRKQALEQLIRPYGHKVVGRVQVVEAVVEQARRFVADPGVAVNYGGKGRLVLSGATENAAVQERIQRLAEDFHPAVLVSDKVQYRPKKQEASGEPNSLWANWQSLLPSRVVSITEDAEGMRHIQLANGHRYYEGALLKSGAELKLVTPNELVIAPQGGTP